MTDLNERPQRPGFLAGLGRAMGRPPMQAWNLTVIGADKVTPRMRRVSFAASDLAAQAWRPGQDLVLMLPQPDGSHARRHYTIRNVDKASGRIDIDFVLHGDSPAGRWARGAERSQAIEAHGPRGRTSLAADVGHHLFLGDETCIPGIFAMAESMPAGAKATALIEICDAGEEQPLATAADVHIEWISRNGAAPGPNSLLLDRLQALNPSANDTHAYVIGETSNVRTQRHYLLASGFDKARITAEGYWRPGRVGGHDHV
jgi:NADPH-dependent ferric siderophore reductase